MRHDLITHDDETIYVSIKLMEAFQELGFHGPAVLGWIHDIGPRRVQKDERVFYSAMIFLFGEPENDVYVELLIQEKESWVPTIEGRFELIYMIGSKEESGKDDFFHWHAAYGKPVKT